MSRICPDCETDLIDESVDGVVVNACPKCAGVWVHPEALTEILDRDPVGLLELEDKNVPQVTEKIIGHTLRHCPDDSMTLQEYHYCYNSPVIIQVCSDCGGFWIEDGQLKRMQDWINEAQQPMTEHEKGLLAVAQFTEQHEAFMHRQAAIQQLCKTLRTFRGGWII